MSARPCLSVVVPVYNEEENIAPFCKRLRAALAESGLSWELVAVNDGSQDRSQALLETEMRGDPRLRVIRLARNFGHQPAVTAGLDRARGEAVVIIDADLQDPPELIPDLLARWRAGYEVVYAVRATRAGESRFKLWTAHVFYQLIGRITEVDIPRDVGDFRLMDRKVVDALGSMREHNRFIRGMTSWVGFRQTGVPYTRQARHAGESKYPLRRMLRFALDAITGFSWFPLQLMIFFCLALGGLALLVIPVIALLRVTLGPTFLGGQVTTIVLLLVLSAFQLFFLFILGQYIARIYDEVRERPLYVVAETSGFGREGMAGETRRHTMAGESP